MPRSKVLGFGVQGLGFGGSSRGSGLLVAAGGLDASD